MNFLNLKSLFSTTPKQIELLGLDKNGWNVLNSKVQKLILDTLKVCELNNIDLKISNNRTIDYGGNTEIQVNGYFGPNFITGKNELGIAMGKHSSEWVPVFIHESCHLDQFLENTYEWNNIFWKEEDCYDLMDKWMFDQQEFSQEDIDEIINRCIDLELDCEKRTVMKLKKYKLNKIININEYIQKSNAYIYFYGVIKNYKRWYKPGNAPYEIKDVWKQLEIGFWKDKEKYYKPDKFTEWLIMKYCYDINIFDIVKEKQ